MSDEHENSDVIPPEEDFVGPPTQEVECHNCGTIFTPTPATDDHPGFCSRRCKRHWWRRNPKKDAAKPGGMKALPAALLKTDALTPEEVEALRGRIAIHVANQIEHANEVVLGINNRQWDATRARLFTTMLNKVVPDVRAEQANKDLPSKKPLSELTRDELEQLAMDHIKRETMEWASVDPETRDVHLLESPPSVPGASSDARIGAKRAKS